jgi:hypothetical protein
MRKVYAAVLAIAVLAAAATSGWLIYSANQLELEHQQNAKARADNYTNRASVAEQRTCAHLAAKAKLDCIKEERQTARQGRHDEYDLQAQFVMSVWTRYMGVAAIIGMAVGIFGLGLVFVTFHETRKANEIAREAFEAQLRPWVKIDLKEAVRFILVSEGGTEKAHFHAQVTIENIGASPALKVSYFAAMAFVEPTKAHLDATISMYADGTFAWNEPNLFHGDNIERRISCEHDGDMPSEPIELGYYIVVLYQTPFSAKPRYTAQVYQVFDRRRDDGLIDFANPPHGDKILVRHNDDFVGYVT